MADPQAHLSLLGRPDRELRLIAGQATHQHFKGGLYRLLGPVRDASTGLWMPGVEDPEDGRAWLVYEHIYPHERQLWIRTRAEWNEMVDWQDGTRRPRFRLLLGTGR